MASHVLVIDDDVRVAESLHHGLTAEEYAVTIELTGDGGLRRATADRFDLILLDWLLPGRNGLDVLGAARAHGVRTPILMLTARDSIEDRVQSLDAGADDYLVKPFAFAELLARMRVLLRSEPRPAETFLVAGPLAMDLLARIVARDGHVIPLTMREFDILALLLRHAGHVVSREMIINACWRGYEHTAWLDNVIDVHMGRIRKKVDADNGTTLIETIRGVGFSLKAARR